MIDRYSERDVAALWDEYNRLKVMLDVELAVCQAWCEQGRIPQEALEDIVAHAHFTVERVQEIEKRTQHDVVAFVSAVAENIGSNGRYLHLGMTSSDILDTASSIMLRDSLNIALEALEELDAAACERIHEDYVKARRAWIAEIRKDAEKEFAMGDVEREVFDDFLEKLDHEIDYEN